MLRIYSWKFCYLENKTLLILFFFTPFPFCSIDCKILRTQKKLIAILMAKWLNYITYNRKKDIFTLLFLFFCEGEGVLSANPKAEEMSLCMFTHMLYRKLLHWFRNMEHIYRTFPFSRKRKKPCTAYIQRKPCLGYYFSMSEKHWKIGWLNCNKLHIVGDEGEGRVISI